MFTKQFCFILLTSSGPSLVIEWKLDLADFQNLQSKFIQSVVKGMLVQVLPFAKVIPICKLEKLVYLCKLCKIGCPKSKWQLHPLVEVVNKHLAKGRALYGHSFQ